ncbi:hypothetical protein M0R45_010398 [Rubus argutus]
MAVWVRIMGLPVEYFQDFALKSVGKPLGEVVKINKLTLAQSRGKFCRICVEIDLMKPLLPFVEVEGFAYSVVYEGISMICFNCGCYGHVMANCTLPCSNETNKTNAVPVKTPSATGVDSAEITTNASPAVEINALTDIASESKQGRGHGPWMLMSYKNKKMNAAKLPANMTPVKLGSRFALLQTFSEGFDDAMREEPPTPIEELGKKYFTAEPKIATQWKKVQAKAKGIAGASSSGGIPCAPVSKTTPKSLKPLKDITNGKLDLSKSTKSHSNVPKQTTRTHSISQSRKKHSEAHDPTAITPFPNLESLISGVQAQPLQSDSSILFGHCPSENLDSGTDCTISMDVLLPEPPHNDQVCSDLVVKDIDAELSHENIDTDLGMTSNLEDMFDD